MGEPARAAGARVLLVAGTHVGTVGAHLEPLAQEALVISRLKSNFSVRDLPQRSPYRKGVEHLLTRPVHDGSPRDDHESRNGGLEAHSTIVVRSRLAEQLGFLRLIAPVHQAQVHPDTVGVASDIRRRKSGGLNNLSVN